jgi:anti-sigma B factor antagonist
MAELLRVERCPEGLFLAGEIDASTAPLLDEAIDAYLAQHRSSDVSRRSSDVASGSPTVRLAMGAVTFLDSTGLRTLLEATEAARAMGGDVVVLDPTAPVRRIVEVTGLGDHLTIEPRHPGSGPAGAPDGSLA